MIDAILDYRSMHIYFIVLYEMGYWPTCAKARKNADMAH